ncbi:hypothetical protein N9L68_03730 [bacterium]|nr:hypothetical protein [bacterium]
MMNDDDEVMRLMVCNALNMTMAWTKTSREAYIRQRLGKQNTDKPQGSTKQTTLRTSENIQTLGNPSGSRKQITLRGCRHRQTLGTL